MKKGITISIMVLTIIIMFILISISTVVGTRAIQTASYEEYLSKLSRVSASVNEYYLRNKSLPITTEIIAKEGLTYTLDQEIQNNLDTKNNLFVVDMSKINVESVNIGNGTIQDLDVFLVAENTNNLYYLKGAEYRGKIYHSITVEDDVTTSRWVLSDFTITKGSQTLEIGDIVNYDETNGGKITGITDVSWQVLGIDEFGQVLIVSSDNVSEKTFGNLTDINVSQQDYTKAITTLNEICMPYTGGQKAIYARSITADDVNRITEYSLASFGLDTIYEYGREVSFYWDGTNKPAYEYKVLDNTKKNSMTVAHDKGFYFGNTKVDYQKDNSTDKKFITKLRETYYNYNYDASSDVRIDMPNKAYDMLFGAQDTKAYWLANAYTYIQPNCNCFGVMSVYSGSVGNKDGKGLFSSNGVTYEETNGVRVVVALDTSTVFSGSSNTSWNIN